MAGERDKIDTPATGLTATARVRVVPSLPYVEDFAKVPDGAVPQGWVNAQGKFVVATVDGKKVLRKVNDNASPTVSRGNAYLGLPSADGVKLHTRYAAAFSTLPSVRRWCPFIPPTHAPACLPRRA